MLNFKIKSIKKSYPDLLIFICGDFNDTSKSIMYQECLDLGYSDSHQPFLKEIAKKAEKNEEPQQFCTMFTPSFTAVIDYLVFRF